MQKVIVVGAGVNGLSTAKRLREAGHDVTVAAESFSPNTVSNAAAAVWKPYSSEKSQRAGLWAKVTLNVLMKQANDPTSGITPLWVNQIGETKLPWWSKFVPEEITKIHLTKATIKGKEVPNCRYRSVVADMSIYMPWLMKQCEQAGIKFREQSVDNLEEVLHKYDAAVICTGGDKKLCPKDTKLSPLTGVVLVYPGRLTDQCWSMYNKDDPSAPTYINPREDTTIVGGTLILSKQELTPKFLEEIRDEIYGRAVKLLPSLPEPDDSCQIVHAARPFCKKVCLEKKKVNGKTVVFNYGHGGAGMTYSEGCAMEVSIMLGGNLDLQASRKPEAVLTGAKVEMPKPRRVATGWEAVKALHAEHPTAISKQAEVGHPAPLATI